MTRKDILRTLAGLFAIGLFSTIAVVLIRPADAARNSVGTMSAANGPYVAGTVISASVVNTRFSDIETEITDSLSRSGKGGMTAALRGADGTVAAPAFSFTNETGTGLYRIGASDLGLAVNGSKREEVTASTTTMVNNVLMSGTLGVTGAATMSGTLGVTGAATLADTSVASSNLVSLSGTGQTSASVNTTTTLGAAIGLNDNAQAAGNGGLLMFGSVGKYFGAIKGFLQNGSNNFAGDLVFATRANATDSTLTEQFRVLGNGSSGVRIGATGTAISARYRGTGTIAPGTVAAATTYSTTITVTGAAAGADCRVTPSYDNGMSVGCTVTLNTCNVAISNQSAAGISGGSQTYSCVVENP